MRRYPKDDIGSIGYRLVDDQTYSQCIDVDDTSSG